MEAVKVSPAPVVMVFVLARFLLLGDLTPALLSMIFVAATLIVAVSMVVKVEVTVVYEVAEGVVAPGGNAPDEEH